MTTTLKTGLVLGVTGLAVCILFVLIVVNKATVFQLLNTYDLVPKSDPLTELYLDNYLQNPQTISPNTTFHFSFTIFNHEGATTTYPYTVYAVLQNSSSSQAIASSSVTLADEASTTIQAIYMYRKPVEIYVSLPDQHEQLHFTLPHRE